VDTTREAEYLHGAPPTRKRRFTVNARRLPAALAVAILSTAIGLAADDAYGDPIPEGAKVRLGTARMRSTSIGVPTAITPDGKFLVAPLTDTGAVYIDLATGKVSRTLRAEAGAIAPAWFSADGKRAVIGGYSPPLVVETETGKVLAKFTRATPAGEHAVSIAADGKRLAIGGMKAFDQKDPTKRPTAIVWDVDANKELASVTPGQNETVNVALAGNGKLLATWGYHYERDAKQPLKPENDPGRQVQFWEAETGKELAKATLTTGYSPSAVAISPDGSVAAVAPGDGSVQLFDPATGKSKGLLLGRSRQGRKLAFSPDGKIVAAGADDGFVQLWSVAEGKLLATTAPPVPLLGAPRGLQFVAGDRLVAWAIHGSTAIAWEVPSGKLLTPAGGHSSALAGVAVAAGGKEIYTGATDGVILRWDAATGKELGPLALKLGRLPFGPVLAALSPDGTRALTLEGGTTLGVYALPSGTQQFVIPGNTSLGTRGAFSADGSKLIQAISSYDPKTPGRAAVWDSATGKKLGEVELPGVSDVAAAVSPDGKTLVTTAVKRDPKGPGNVIVTGWELATGKKVGEYAEPSEAFVVVPVAIAGDNRSAVVMSPRDGPIVVDVVAGTKTRALEGAKTRVGSILVVSPDGKTVAVSQRVGFEVKATASVLLFDIESGKVKKTLAGMASVPTAMAFSADGKTLVTGFGDTTALVWDIAGQ
jgi:WD40 repeat protein